MRVMLSIVLLLACLGRATAQDLTIERIEIVATGIFRAGTAATETAPGTATGTRHVLAGATLITSTTRIEAKVGLHFGMLFRVIGRPEKAPVRLTSITHYPAPGLKNPQTGTVMARGENTLAATIGARLVNYRGYVFEHEWELMPGAWIFELWHDKRMLAKQAFEVVRP
jgi:hypothetical protein